MGEPTGPASERLAASFRFADGWLSEDAVLTAARGRAAEVGATPVSPGAGATLRVLAATISARHVVEVGTGTGVSGVWLLRGMAPDGVLTTIDVEAEHQRLARIAYTEAEVPSHRVRLITGKAMSVLPRLTDGVYDLVLLDAAKGEYPLYLSQALRLLRPGGILIADNALWHDRVADPSVTDEETKAIREFLLEIREHPDLIATLTPVGDGMVVAVKRSQD